MALAQFGALHPLADSGHEELVREAAFEQAQALLQPAGATGGHDDGLGYEVRPIGALARRLREPREPAGPEERNERDRRENPARDAEHPPLRAIERPRLHAEPPSGPVAGEHTGRAPDCCHNIRG